MRRHSPDRSPSPGKGAGRVAAVLRSYGEVARSPAYAPLWLAQLTSQIGDTLHYLALVVLVYELTGRGVAVAGLVAAEIVPVLVLGPVAGVLIDRVSRKAILIGSDLIRAGLALSLIWPQGAWHAYAVAAGLATGGVFFNPTVQAVIPHLTTEGQRLAANSVSWTTGRLVQIVGAAAAGGLIATVGTRPAFALNAATFAVSAVLLVRLRVPTPAAATSGVARGAIERFFGDVRAGLAFARKDRFVSRLLLVQSLASLAVGATGAMLVVLAERHLRLEASGFAWLIGAIGVGALLGPLLPNALAADVRDPRWLFVPYVVRGAGDVLIATVPSVPAALAIMVVYGVCTSTGMVVFGTTLQGAIPDHVRGRVFTLLDVDWNVLRLASLAAGGVLVDVIGIRPVFWIGGGLLALSGGLGLALLRPEDLRPAADREDPRWSDGRTR